MGESNTVVSAYTLLSPIDMFILDTMEQMKTGSIFINYSVIHKNILFFLFAYFYVLKVN